MKSRARKLGLLLCACILGAAGCSGGAGDAAPEDAQLQKTNILSKEDMEKDTIFESVIEENGITYELKGVDYEMLEPETVYKDETKTVESDVLPEGQPYTPEETVTEGDITYTLTKTETREEILKEAYSQPVSGYTDYPYAITAADVPQSKEVTVANIRTGQQETVACSLAGIERLPVTYEDTYIDIVYESYDANQFIWGDTIVSKNEQTPEIDEGQLLASVGADSASYDVQRVYWTSQPYTDANGVLCRNARADVSRLVSYYRASYSGSIEQPEEKGVRYVSTYTGQVPDEDKGGDSQVQAIAHYVERTIPHALLLAGAGIGIAILLVVAVLYVISKKKKHSKTEE